jgi:hypothetical protein
MVVSPNGAPLNSPGQVTIFPGKYKRPCEGTKEQTGLSPPRHALSDVEGAPRRQGKKIEQDGHPINLLILAISASSSMGLDR